MAPFYPQKVLKLPGTKLIMPLESLAQLIADKPARPRRPIKVAVISGGLGRVQRGFEVSTRRLFDALQKHTSLELRLFAGGKSDGAKEVINIPRDFLLNTVLLPVAFLNRRRIWEFAYGVEQVSFAIFLLADLMQYQPDVVWTKEAPLAHVLYYAKAIFGLKFKILFANGGGFKPATYAIFDHIQQLEASSMADAVAAGVSECKMTVLPNALPFQTTTLSREGARSSFGFSPMDFVVVCVAAWNSYHKRIDFLIEEVANMRDPSIHLLLCGHPEPDSGNLKDLARRKLGNRAHWYTLPEREIPRALKAGDVFVLPSITEHFGSAALEACIAALPVVVHPNGATRLLSETALETTDLSKPGSIQKRLTQLKANPPRREDMQRLAQIVKERFSEKVMSENFLQMVQSLCSDF
jgi:1,2-diacylglycerol 3-alpha-glucosyltransferase